MSWRFLSATSAGTGGTMVWPSSTLSIPAAVTITHVTSGGDPALTITNSGDSTQPGLCLSDDNTGLFGTGGGAVGISCNGTQGILVSSTATNIASTLQIAAVQVVKARITGWAVPSASKARTTFADFAGTVSDPPTQAEVNDIASYLGILSARLAAIVQDGHGTAGHGLIGT